MTNFAHWISPELMRTLGWTLLHFVWQGAALAALFAAAMTACRSAAARYALAVGALALMMASPVITFVWLQRETIPAVRSGAQRGLPGGGPAARHAVVAAVSDAPAAASRNAQPIALLWLVQLWFLGVLVLSLRTAGGLLLIERMRRKEIKPIGQELHERCMALERRMGLDRVIRYCECHRLDAPAVLGWFRPVVLLPVRVLTGMDEQQIEAVIAHELAHIRRLDCFVNLFQIAVETLLFYHPAVWWVSQRVRAERENCCDDEAISICGDAVVYARALTLMEEWRAAPALAMAANRSPLAERVVRLLGLNGAAARGRTRMAGLGVSFVCLTGALLAGNAFLGVAHASLGTSSSAKQLQESSSVIIVKPEPVLAKERATQAAKSAPAASSAPAPKPLPEKGKEQQAGNDEKKQSYLDAIEAAGFKNLDVDEIIAMKVQGVTPEYIKAMHDLGLQPTPEEVVGMRVQGVTPEYVRDMRTVAQNLSIDDLIGMKVQGVTLQYVRELRELGLQAGADEIVGMKVQGVTPEYVKELRATGINPDVDEIVGMKVQGVTAEYVKTLQSAGFKNLSCDEVIGAKVVGINSEFIEKARKHGFQNLTLEKLIAIRHADIF
jgi:beta-lactamase regulating signal transducer with metallopeptidase domain